jgi:hypothetical protein
MQNKILVLKRCFSTAEEVFEQYKDWIKTFWSKPEESFQTYRKNWQYNFMYGVSLCLLCCKFCLVYSRIRTSGYLIIHWSEVSRNPLDFT